MKRYIRFGEIPNIEKSINYFTDKHEKGVSVFDEKLSLTNLRLISTLASRIGTKAYIVTGDEAGFGNDGEPLLVNVKVIKDYTYSNLDLSNHIFNVMKNCFKTYDGERDPENYYVGRFFKEVKKCNKCGNVVEWYEACCDDGYIKDSWIEYVFNGVTFKDPIENFDCELGVKHD